MVIYAPTLLRLGAPHSNIFPNGYLLAIQKRENAPHQTNIYYMRVIQISTICGGSFSADFHILVRKYTLCDAVCSLHIGYHHPQCLRLLELLLPLNDEAAATLVITVMFAEVAIF